MRVAWRPIPAGLVLAVFFGQVTLDGADIHGNIRVERILTKRNVTLAAGLYQRGVAVPLSSDAGEDRLAYERSHVVVYLEGERASKPITATIEQRDRRFEHDLVVIPAGSSVSFPNFDPVFHNVFSLSRSKSFDLGNYRKGEARAVNFAKSGIVSVFCHLHPNMAATVFVTPNQWGARADDLGQFRLPDVPPGTYVVLVWHKSGGTFRKTVQVTADTGVRVDFWVPLPAEEEAAPHHPR